jgi:CDGSH-type Zn-finger protein
MTIRYFHSRPEKWREAAMADNPNPQIEKVILVQPNGPYLVKGGVPLVEKIQVVTEHGEPITWKKLQTYKTGSSYILCRCGKSKTMPFCDGTHRRDGFDGVETADERISAERQQTFPGGVQIYVRHDDYLCMESGFCGTRFLTMEQFVRKTDDTNIRSQVIAMVERCPSSSLVYGLQEEDRDIEPDLPVEIAFTTDILSGGPVAGAYWVTGYIPIRRSDGKPFELLNRVTLCSCGLSKKKPLCDGAHRKPPVE